MSTDRIAAANLALTVIQPSEGPFRKLGRKGIDEFRQRLESLDISFLPVDDEILKAPESPLAQPFFIGDFKVGNRWTIHPMEGWDGFINGILSENCIRRWQRFGSSGAKLIWGGESVAIQEDARANPNQLFYHHDNETALRTLFNTLTEAHRNRFGTVDDLLVGLQLTHSGRFCKPNDIKRFEPKIAFHHPLLDKKFGIDTSNDSIVLTDDDLQRIRDRYIELAKMAERVGFKFVDVKQCHGYLLHELLSAYDRPGRYGGDFEGRTRLLTEIIEGIKAETNLIVTSRLSAFDTYPYNPDASRTDGKTFGPGIPMQWDGGMPYPGFGLNRDNPSEINLGDPIELISYMKTLGVKAVNISAGSPYYNPHIQRPAFFLPCDAYQLPEDPLLGVARQINVVKLLKEAIPDMPMIGTGYTYLQEHLPNVAQAVVRKGWVDSVGIGRMVLSYPELPADCLEYGELRTPQLICRTFSDCTTGARNGLVSGCFPLDPHYRNSADFAALQALKRK